MDELYYQALVIAISLIAAAIKINLGEKAVRIEEQYYAGKARLQQLENLIRTGNEIVEDDKITAEEAKRFIKQVQALCS